MGCILRVGGGWSSDLAVADCEGLENLSTSEVHVNKLKRHAVSHEDTHSFQCADGTFNLYLVFLVLDRGEKPV